MNEDPQAHASKKRMSQKSPGKSRKRLSCKTPKSPTKNPGKPGKRL